jgi:hypothetical protein
MLGMSITEKQREKLQAMLATKGRKVDREEVVRRYLAGESVVGIAEALRVHTQTIYLNLKAAARGG